MHKKEIVLLALSVMIFLFSCPSCAQQPIQKAPNSCLNNLNAPISNFCEVTKNVLWRGAKPDENGAAWLIDNGVRTIVNLETAHDDLPTIRQANITNPGTFQIEYFLVPHSELQVFNCSKQDECVVHFLAIASQQARQPVYVHCRDGQNRTGVMVAAYKIIIEGNTNIHSVIDEMYSYQGFWSPLDAHYIRGLSDRRNEILQKVEDKKPTLEKPTQIICTNRECE